MGFGGGSTYNALLILAETNYQLVPTIALICNIIVVTGSAIIFFKHKLIPWRLTIPLVLVSVPFAWLGGYTPIHQFMFNIILGSSLLLAGLLMLIRHSEVLKTAPWTKTKLGLSCLLPASACLGMLSGLVGIGGGIFFSPILHLSKAAPSKNIAAFASFFILINSISGLIGQSMKHSESQTWGELHPYTWLFFAVLIGGQIGSRLGVQVFRPEIVRRLTSVLVIYVGIKLIYMVLGAPH